MLYEVITQRRQVGDVVEGRIEVPIPIGWLVDVAGIGCSAPDAVDVLGRAEGNEGRITSYNVCYTKLLRGANLDFGTLKDPHTAAELERTALGVSVGYGFKKLNLASAVEYRVITSYSIHYTKLYETCRSGPTAPCTTPWSARRLPAPG